MQANLKWLTEREIAHRGYHATTDAPENSLLSFRYAIERGLPVEMDAQILGDGSVVVFHDYNGKRLLGENLKLRDYTAQTIKENGILGSDEKVPLLSEVLSFINGRTPILLEIKGEGISWKIERAIWQIVRNYRGPIAIQAFNPWTVWWFRHNMPTMPRGILGRPAGHYKVHKFFGLFRSRLIGNLHTAPHFIGFDCHHVDRMTVQLWRRALNIPLLAWTVKTQEELDFVDGLVDNIIFENFDYRY
ncbi:MAG: glycerophosphodiester phosphodiesterase family protein [Bacteriovoracaceae bacterium]